MRSARRLGLLALVAALLAPGAVRPSAATFTAASANPGASFSTSSDFNTVSVALADPGTPLRGTVRLSATAASDRGIAAVAFQSAPAGSTTWVDACTDASAPFACDFDTTGVADGLRDVRAVATDRAGYARTHAIASRRLDNTAPATGLADPGQALRGTVTLSATASDTGSGLASVAVQVRSSGAGAWSDLCTATASPVSCSWATATSPDGLYDLRVLARDGAGNTGTSTLTGRRVDNTSPAVAPADPGSPLRGTISLQATASDAGAGVAAVRHQYRPAGGATWADACTSTSSPFSCPFATTSLPDGSYDFRAVATDGAGNTATSATVTARQVDNTAPTGVSLADPGTPLQGAVSLSGTATDAGAGVASLQMQYAPAGTTTWSDACSATVAPFSCSWATTAVADGVYDLRAVATDRAGNAATSATVASRRVDNQGPALGFADPGQYLRGTVTFTATATDGVGVTSVAFQGKLSSAATWSTICTDTTAPYSCPYTTTNTADGLYDLRAVATDTLGHASSVTHAGRTVDNTPPAAADVQGSNGGTARRLDAGDALVFTWSEAVRPASVLAGWSGSATGVTLRVKADNPGDTFAVHDASNAARVNLTSLQPLQTKAHWVTADTTFAATMTLSGATVTVTLGALTSGAVATGVTDTTPLQWTPSTAVLDLAGNAASGTAATESGAADVDF